MKIAFIGSHGIPASYGGYETFVEQLAIRLASKKHNVTVYNRSNFIKDKRKVYCGIRIISLPSIKTKHLDTISHSAISSFHAIFQNYDIVYYCIVGNSPLTWIPRITGGKTFLNVDGEDWAREKWSGFARWYQKKCERLCQIFANTIIADASVIKKRYKEKYGIKTIFVPYGANKVNDYGDECLNKWKLSKRKYFIFVGRLVPENSIELLIRSFNKIDTDMKLVIIGDAPYMDKYISLIKGLADHKTIFTGYAFGKDYDQLSSNAYAYIQPSNINATRPALLDQLGYGNCVLVRKNEANMEVIKDCGTYFDETNSSKNLEKRIKQLIASPETVEIYRLKAKSRIEKYYNWDWITEFYEDQFRRIIKNQSLISYDEYITKKIVIK